MIIDSHVHFWRRADGDDLWICGNWCRGGRMPAVIIRRPAGRASRLGRQARTFFDHRATSLAILLRVLPPGNIGTAGAAFALRRATSPLRRGWRSSPG